jgi:hypothetical protein
MKHDFVASYTLALFFDRIHHGPATLARDWSVSGATRFATGFPVTLFDNSDNSLLGTLGNGANNYLLDTPRYTPGRSISTSTDATASPPSIRIASRKDFWDNWETRSGACSTARVLRTST